MNDVKAGFCDGPTGRRHQLRQQLPGWSGISASWLDQTDIPVHLVRYEDMQADTAGMLRRALAFAGRAASDEEIARAARFARFSRIEAAGRSKRLSRGAAQGRGGLFSAAAKPAAGATN